ncbi:hypothetical protein [Microbulbifer sp. 2205BS26-8]|uniref:hypothetical protein n=1 Tax=Microbulbifer sp. 2205BS26-8 TaxID=3064386 RepID=UPI00273D7E3E|nr:hypothetical protein [Microbulbifer sp. 2205BS26-8]MDP5209837.1 hypothetical protein [Microbulbifer sp. 2205BS26-8]
MNMKNKNIGWGLIAASFLAYHGGANADEIKLDEVMKSRIYDTKGNENHPYTKAANAACESISGDVPRRIACFTHLLLGVNVDGISNIKLYNPDVVYSEIKEPEIPETVQYEYYSVKNCTSLPKNINQEVSVTVNESNTISVSDTVTTTDNASLNAKLELKTFSIEGGGSKTRVVDISKSTSSTTSSTTTVREVLDETILPYSALIYTVDKRYGNTYIDFVGSFSYDADLAMFGRSLGKFSRYFNNNYVSVSGQIWNVNYKSVHKSYVELPLPTDPAECNAVSLDDFLGKGVRHQTLSLL